MTGRGAGYCGGSETPGFVNPGFGRGRGRGGQRGWGGFGAGRGGWRHRHWFHATGLPGWQRAGIAAPGFSEEQELAALKQEAQDLERALRNLRDRIRESEKPETAGTSPEVKEGQ